MKYLFILGRNVELSVEEIKSSFERDKINFKIISLVDNGLLVETEKNLQKGIIEKFGGVISIGEVLISGTFDKISEELDKKNLYFGTSNKLNYVVFDFNGKNFEKILFYLKQRFKEERLKATLKKLTGNIKLQSGEIVSNVASNLINEQYFVFENNFGRIIEEYDYDSVEKRDMEKPVRRNELSISPRLAKILINLSQVREGEILLDPFCGIGVVLQEALLQKIKVIGVDSDKIVIENAKRNMKWFNFFESNYQLINRDSTKVRVREVSCIVTEPDLGELQRRTPSDQKAKEIIANFEKLMINVLRNLKQHVTGRIVFTAPLVVAVKGKISPDFEKIANESGLKMVLKPIQEFRESSIVGRNIIVME
ncbi:tRNA (guanine(10)-N2)-dimethyltransferase [uncultured archaeon]|nr:tRNA (guanine(10)-N2)-dimethyltransferase [uncultured archaeon]